MLSDKQITQKVPRKQIEYALELRQQRKNIDTIFARVFQTEETSCVKSCARARPPASASFSLTPHVSI